MKTLFLSFLIFYTSHTYASDELNANCQNKKINLNIFYKDDFSFNSQLCANDDRSYIINFLQNNSQSILINKKEEEFGYDYPVLEAVSVFKKGKLPPLLITLHSEYVCCYPRPEGKSYAIDLYKIIKDGGKFKINSYTSILGENNYGFDGQNDVREKVHFKLKDIASIKKWLDKNYK